MVVVFDRVMGKAHCVILDNVGAHLEFSLPDSDRDWETEFQGVPKSRKKKQTSEDRVDSSLNEKTFEEGSDELVLIESVDSYIVNQIEQQKFVWSTKDDNLLETLFKERNCPISLIASVFNLEDEIIISRIKELRLE